MGESDPTPNSQPESRKRRYSKINRRGGPSNRSGRKRRQPPPTKPTLVCCVVCQQQSDKSPDYKCPKCLAMYCSVKCYKAHKAICAGAPPKESSNAAKPSSRVWNVGDLHLPTQQIGRQKGDDDDDLGDGWKLTDDMKTAVGRSDWLRHQFQEGGLRELIRQIVDSGNPEALQHVQRRFPQFQMFLDKLLVIAGVLERENDSDGDAGEGEDCEPLDEWLKRDWSQDAAPPQLSLKLPPRRGLPVFPPVDVSSSSSGQEEDDDSSSNSSNSSSTESGTREVDEEEDEGSAED